MALDYAVEVVSPPAKTAAPGEFVTQVFTVVNRGGNADTYDLEIAIPSGWALLGLPGTLSVSSGESAKVFVSVLIPATAAAGEYVLILQAISQADPTVSDKASCIIEIIEAAAVLVIPPAGQEAQAGRAVTYSFAVENTGNISDIFEMEADSSRGYQVASSPQSLALLYGERAQVEVTMQIPADAKPGIDRLTLKATSTKYPAIYNQGSVLTKILPPGPEAAAGTLYWTLPSEAQIQTSLVQPLQMESWQTSLRSSGTIPKLFSFNLTLSDLTEVQTTSFTLDLNADPPGPFGVSLSKSSESIDMDLRFGLPKGGMGVSYVDMLQTDAHKLTGSLSMGMGELMLNGTGIMTRFSRVEGYSERIDLGWGTREFRLKTRLFRNGANFRGGGKDTEGFRASMSFSSMWLSLLSSYSCSRNNVENEPLPVVTVSEEVTRLAGGLHFQEVDLSLGYGIDRSGSNDSPATTDREQSKVTLGFSSSLPPLFFSFSTRSETIFDRGAINDDDDFWCDNNGNNTFDSGIDGVYLDNDTSETVTLPPDTQLSSVSCPLGSPLSSLFDEDWVNGTDDDSDALTDEDAPTDDQFDIAGMNLIFIISYGQLYGRMGLSQETIRSKSGAIEDQSFETALGLGFLGAPASGSLCLSLEEERISLSFGASILIGEDTTLSFSSSIGAHTLTGEQDFSFGLNLASRFETPTPFAVKGQIEGRLFVDANRNGVYNPGEEEIPHVIISADGAVVLTGADGLFRFPPFWPGWYELRIKELPAGLVPAIELPVWVKLGAGETKEIDLPLRRVATIEGMVFDDDNRDAVHSEGEQGLPRVRVRLSGSSISQTALTNSQGRFSFVSLEPGEYAVRLDTATLPERYEPITPAQVRVILSAGEWRSVEFAAAEKERELVITYNPIAAFVVTPEQPKVGEPVTFDASASYDPDGRIIKFEWDFNSDGTIDDTGKIVEWIFAEPGIYSVKLTVTDNDGFTSSVTKEVQLAL